MRVLHIIRRANDHLALEAAGQHGPEGTILLIQDGVRTIVSGTASGHAGPVYAAAEDVGARGIETDHELLSADQICRKIVEHERTIVW